MKSLLILVCSISVWFLLIAGCSAGKYENPVPLIIGETNTINCSLPKVDEWKFKDRPLNRNDKYKLLEDNKKLQIHKTDYNDEGIYECSGSGSKIIFTAKGKPRFKITTSRGRIDVKSIHANEGSVVDMICYIPNKDEIPKNETYDFIWEKGDVAVNSLRENSREHILIIENITQSDRDMYACTAFNGVLNHTERIRLRVKDSVTYIWPSVGIVCEIVILVLIILIFEKRGVKPEYEESDNDANTDVKKSS